MVVKSFSNTKIKYLRKQKNNKFLLFLDTPKLIEEAVLSGLNPKEILIDEKKFDTFKKRFPFVCKLHEENILLTTEEIISSLADVQTPQGILGVFEIKQRNLCKPQGNFLILDNVQDAGNVGTLLRSALGANFRDVYLLDCAKISNIKTIRSSMGAAFRLNIFETTRQDFIKFFKTVDENIIVCDMDGENFFKTSFSERVGLILGNEGNGVSSEMKSFCNKSVAIPMKNNLESLNVAVAGSIIMFEISNR